MDIESIVNLKPGILEATSGNGDQLLVDDFYDREFVHIEVPQYDGMSAGQTVGGRWRGPSSIYDTSIWTVTIPARVALRVPRREVLDAIGSTVPVTFSVKRGSGPIEISDALNLRVQGTPLPMPTINAGRTQVTVLYGTQVVGQTTRVRWEGRVVRDTELQAVVPGLANIFSIPAGWVSESAGTTVFITYAIGTTASDPYLFSRVLRVAL
ncbi:hypothetical protein PIN31115_02493 [Pandoraea iniqua]|uniref:Uncharacterized protein n=1 Tax=Pandoraea iniqua TaxID=2508288 RepID=A0A5E4V8S4_9BURK|nr:hypothetical protein [Pandoraea iniqua]VVE08608.1 hypothetical protein PIN31115_02493 [Pandoraea iniqua]